MKGMLCKQNSAASFSPMSLLLRYYMALADGSGLSRNCAEAAGLPPATLRHYKGLTWQVDLINCLGTANGSNPCIGRRRRCYRWRHIFRKVKSHEIADRYFFKTLEDYFRHRRTGGEGGKDTNGSRDEQEVARASRRCMFLSRNCTSGTRVMGFDFPN
jgi:hypothetical protein